MLYKQVLIIVKYLFQFNFYPWNQPNSLTHDKINAVYIFGVEKKDDYAVFDLFLLFSLFIHRSILKVSNILYLCILHIHSADLSPCTGCRKLILLTLYGGPAAAVR